MKKTLAVGACLIICLAFFSLDANAQRKAAKARQGKICGNPALKCRTGDWNFQAYELPFEVPRGGQVIVESEEFYAIVLKSVKLKSDYSNCGTAISEAERLQVQSLFSANKVFALKCMDAGSLYYMTNDGGTSYLAVYAGKTLADAKAFLKTVEATGKYKGANIRKMRAQVNGT